jgi:hypothetical protein
MAIFTRTGGRVLFLLALGAFALASSPSAAQITRGAISGVVHDPSGLVVPGATVTVTNEETHLVQSTTTEADGFYRVAALEPGRYTVKTELQGFATVETKDVVVPPSMEVRVPVELKVGAVTETVSVLGATMGVSLNKVSPTIGFTIGEKQIVEMPMGGGRNINGLILTAPNVSMAGFTNNAGQGTYIVNGQRSRNNNYMIDGSDNNDISVTISTATLVPESVAEFQVLTNPYAVEFGRNTGGQINVITKSGGDRFKGDVWDYYTTSKFYSLTNLEKANGLTEPSRYYRHQAGGDLGGPIVKGKTFFYGLFQYDPQRPAATPSTTTVRIPTQAGFAALSNVPLGAGQTAASRQGVLGQLSFLNNVYSAGPVFRSVTNTLVNGVPIETGLTNVNIIAPSTYKTWQGRVDQKITINDNLTVRELYNPKADDNQVSNCTFGSAFCGGQDLKDQNLAVSETHVFKSAKLNEFRFSLVRRDLDFPENDPKSSTATISGLFQIGGNNNFPQSRVSNAYQFSDTFTWTKSKHTFKFGADLRYNVLDNISSFDVKGTFQFDNLQNYMNDFATFFQQAQNVYAWTAKQWQNFLFAQDDFRVTPELTLNLGLRYEVSGVPLGFFGATDPLSLGALVPGPVQRDTNNWAPRVGAAWSPSSKNQIIGDGKSVFRAGFGIGYDVLFYNLLTVNGSNYPNIVVGHQDNVQNLYPNTLPLTGTVTFDPLATYTNSPVDTQNPDARYYSASWQRDIWNTLFEIGYTGSHTYHGINQWQMNPAVLTPAQAAAVAAARSVSVIPTAQARRIFPQYGQRVVIPAYVGPNGVDAEARSVYNAVYFSGNKRLTHGVQVAASYTYSSLYSNNDASLGEGGTDGSSQRPQSFFDIASEWSVSQFDRPHRFTSSYSWEIPGPKSGWLGQVLNGWQLTGITQIQSGRPFTIGTGADSNGDGQTGSDRPNINPAGTVVWDDAHASFVNNGYYVAPLGTNGLPLSSALGNGNAPRNSERGARFVKTDFSLIKNFKIGGGRLFSVRGDLLNAFKNPDYGIPVANMSSPSFGQNTNNWGRRSVQLAAKLTF